MDNDKTPAYAVLTDESLMPYGKHKGMKMKDVPARYLVWAAENDACNKSVRAYITANKEVIYKQAGNYTPKPKAIDFRPNYMPPGRRI